MKRVITAVQDNNLFIKIFLVMVISIVSVTLLITFSTIRMSSTLFMDTFTISNTKVLNQIKSKFEALSYAIVNASMSVQNNGTIKRVLTREDLNTMEMANAYYDITQQMERIYSNIMPYDVNMIIAGNHERLFNMNYSSWPISWDQLQAHPITENTMRQPNQLLYQFSAAAGDDEPRIVASKALTERSTAHVYGILLFSIRERQLRTFFEEYTSTGNDVLLLNEDGVVVSSNMGSMIGSEATDVLPYAKEIEERQLEYRDVHVFGSDYILMSEYLPTFNMYLVNLVDKRMLMANLIDTKEIVIVSIGIVFVAVIVLFIISRRMTKSLSHVVKEISNMAKYDFSKPLTSAKGYEAKKIEHAFNNMLHELHAYVDIVVQTQKKQRDAELRALQHQINPHFLYNTLASVKFVVEQGETEKATGMIHALIALLQSALGNIQQTITVEQELMNTKHYVLINQARFGDRIKVNYLISPDCLNLYIPKLVLQPFIENAFFHAFNIKKEGVIQILMASKAQKLVCEIVDNGDGMETNKDRFTSHLKGKRHLFSGIGISNVQERIQLLYGDEYGVKIFSEQNEGTRVKIELPLLEKA